MQNDTIIDEIHEARAQLLRQHGGDFAAYFAALIKKQDQHPELGIVCSADHDHQTTN